MFVPFAAEQKPCNIFQDRSADLMQRFIAAKTNGGAILDENSATKIDLTFT